MVKDEPGPDDISHQVLTKISDKDNPRRLTLSPIMTVVYRGFSDAFKRPLETRLDGKKSAMSRL